jgi:hypothetical protein
VLLVTSSPIVSDTFSGLSPAENRTESVNPPENRPSSGQPAIWVRYARRCHGRTVNTSVYTSACAKSAVDAFSRTAQRGQPHLRRVDTATLEE